MDDNLKKQKAALDRLEGLDDLFFGGGIYAEPFDPGDMPEALLESIESGPRDEDQTLLAVLRDPTGCWGFNASDAIEVCLIGHLVVFPETFVPFAPEIVDHPDYGAGFLSALGSHQTFYGVASDPYLPALIHAARAPWDEDKLLSLVGGLKHFHTKEGLKAIQNIKQSVPMSKTLWQGWLDEAIKDVTNRLNGAVQSRYEVEMLSRVSRVRQRLGRA